MLHHLRVPRWLQDISALQPLLLRLHHMRQQYFLRPEEKAQRLVEGGKADQALQMLAALPQSAQRDIRTYLGAVQALLSAGRLDEALARARQAVADFPGEPDAWLQLGQVKFAIGQKRPAAAGGEGHGAPAQSYSEQFLLQEDGALLDTLSRPAPDASLPGKADDVDAKRRLKSLAADLTAENEDLALRLEPLRQQLGHRVDALETWIKYEHTKYYMRALALYMRRYGAVEPLPVSPKTIPEHLKQGFAMNGAVQLQVDYLNAAYPEQYQDIYTDFDVAAFQRVWNGEPAASDDDRQCQIDFALSLGPTDKAMQRFVTERVARDGTVAVVGSRGPVYEALCVMVGARPTTLRRTPVLNKAKHLATATFAEWEKAPRAFDAAIAVSTVEQAGLGMHGEALDPDGDLNCMAMLKRMVKPGGLLFLVLPTGADCTVFNATRVYGDVRLSRLLNGWTVVERHRHQEALLHGRDEDRSLFVLSNAA